MDAVKFNRIVRDTIDSRGIKYTYVAEQLGMSKQLLNARLLGQTAWKLDEAMRLIRLLDLPTDVLE